MTSIVAAIAIGVGLVAAPGILADLPTATLAAVVIAAGLSLVDVASIARLWRIGSSEFWLALASFLGVALIGVIEGVFLAVGAVAPRLHPAFVVAARRRARPGRRGQGLPRPDLLPGGAPGPGARSCTGSMRRCSSPMPTSSATACASASQAAGSPVRWVIVAAEPITDVDTTAAAMLDRLADELAASGITLAFAELKDPVRERLRRYGALERIPEDHIYPTVGTAVSAYVRASGESWTDWEEDGGGPALPRRRAAA